MISSLIHKEAVSAILTPGWGLEDFSVALNLLLWRSKFYHKNKEFSH